MRSLSIPVLTIALMAAGAAAAQEQAVFRETDDGLTCAGISDEAARLSDAMGDATPQGGWLSSLGGMARSGAAMLVPGGALAVAGVDAVRQPGRDREEAEQAAVRNRWYYLNGLHIGRGCREQDEARRVSIPTRPLPVPAPIRAASSGEGGR